MQYRLFMTDMIRLPLLAALLISGNADAIDIPDNLKKENLAAWCIVPFDASKRGPEARAQMLKELGLIRCAYDWRAQHVKEFEEEILQYKSTASNSSLSGAATKRPSSSFRNTKSTRRSGAPCPAQGRQPKPNG